MTNVLGTGQTLTLAPPPASGTTLAVKMQPYPGFGCPAIIYNRIKDSLTVIADAGNDVISCNGDAVRIGAAYRQGQVYKWSPQTGLDDPNVSSPFAAPPFTTDYILTTTSRGGGCERDR